MAPQPAQRPAPWYWTCQLVGWGAVTLLNISFSATGAPELRNPLILIWLWGGLTSIVLSHGWRRYLHAHRIFVHGHTLPYGRLMLGVVLLTAAQVGVVFCAFLAWPHYQRPDNLAWLPGAAGFWLFMFACWTVFYGAAMAVRQAKRAEIEKLQLQIQVKDAELRALQAQVNPHFFFNSLNSIRALMYLDVPAAAVDQTLAEIKHGTDCRL